MSAVVGRRAAPWRLVALLASWLACLGGCGSPGGPSAVPPWLPAGTVLTFTSGETGLPVSGASVAVGASSYTTDLSGRITLRTDIARTDIASSMRATLTVNHHAYLQRQTYLRNPDETSFTLWPNASTTGADGNYARNIVYGATMVAPEQFGIGAPLRRLQSGTSMVSIVPSEEIQRDAEAMAAHRHALAVATMASAGRMAFTMDEAAPPGSIVVRTATDASVCGGNLACALLDTSSLYITGGTIAFSDLDKARISGIVLHELGHVLGFWHSGTPGDVMFAPASSEQIRARERFSSKEAFVLRLMYQRPAGNRWPDDDRGVAAASSAGRHTEVISCDFGER